MSPMKVARKKIGYGTSTIGEARLMNVLGKVGVTLKKSMQFNSFFLLLATFKEETENAQRTVPVAISNMNFDKLSNKLSLKNKKTKATSHRHNLMQSQHYQYCSLLIQFQN